jgi:quinol monooxygenase YgiN
MTPEDDKRELGSVELLGRWSCVGEARGFCIARAESVVSMQSWLNGWVSMADIKVVPCLDDNQHRTLILGKSPSFSVSYDSVSNGAKEGESLYFIKYQFRDGCRDQGFEAFANMTSEQDNADSGNCTSYGRWHVPSQGCGYAIASCPNAFDMYRWAYNWNALCDCFITPVTNDEDTRKIIQKSLGFKVKHAQVMEHMKQFMETGPCYISAKFTFKDQEKKQTFLEILRGEEGLAITRAWPGCHSIECFESQENNLEFSIRQKWEKESDHASYMAMRKETGLFASVMEMLSEPLDITHLNCLDC